MRVMSVLLILLVLVIGYGVAVWRVTVSDSAIPVETVEGDESAVIRPGPLDVMIWNVGYAGLGAGSDFKADGGKMMRPPSREAVEANLSAIQSVLSEQSPDVAMMQELARPGFLTRGVDVVGGVREALAGYNSVFTPDIRTRLLPDPMSLRHGLGLFWRGADEADIATVRLPEEPEPILGFIKRRYHVEVLTFSHEGTDWAFVNVHLSAFDEGANTRMQQLREVLNLARGLYESGHAVAIGGDWNMRLAPTDFESTSDESALFWIHDFPREELDEGWQIAIDPSTPTVRTNERPYNRDENYRTIIDGLIVSPNVDVISVRGIDLDFQNTDHQPVRFKLSAKSPADNGDGAS